MNIVTYETEYSDISDLSLWLEYTVACSRVLKQELIKVCLKNKEAEPLFKKTASKLLRSMKREGIIKLFLFSDELGSEKMEAVYLLNKYPELQFSENLSNIGIYIKI